MTAVTRCASQSRAMSAEQNIVREVSGCRRRMELICLKWFEWRWLSAYHCKNNTSIRKIGIRTVDTCNCVNFSYFRCESFTDSTCSSCYVAASFGASSEYLPGGEEESLG